MTPIFHALARRMLLSSVPTGHQDPPREAHRGVPDEAYQGARHAAREAHGHQGGRHRALRAVDRGASAPGAHSSGA